MATTSNLSRWLLVLAAGLIVCVSTAGQEDGHLERVDVRIQLENSARHQKGPFPPAVLWLKPLSGNVSLNFSPSGHYTLLQKNRMFTPHLLVVPIGSVVAFPNADPFFHNVFSLFNGKRFDLGLYEAGTSKEVNFTREGVSYIFCNIHPEMSAVVLALSTPLYSVANSQGTFSIAHVPTGNYEMHIWVEGYTQPSLDRLMRDVQVRLGTTDLGMIDISSVPHQLPQHLNKFGQPYDQDSGPPY